MKSLAATVTGKIVIGALVVFALVTVAFVSPRLVSAASMPVNSGIQTAEKHVTNEVALEHLTGQSTNGQGHPDLNDADSKGDEMAVNGQVNESSNETLDSKETTQAPNQAGDSMMGSNDNQASGVGQELSQTIRTDIVNTLAKYGIDISMPGSESNH